MAIQYEHVKNKSRNIRVAAQYALWGASAGMCEFEGCSERLFSHHVTKEKVNLAERAHIYAFSEGGKRYSNKVAKEEINNFENLMLLCPNCHKLIDDEKTNYSAERLIRMKKEHEKRIRTLTSIKPDKKSEIVIYNANIGNGSICIKDHDAQNSIQPERHPAQEDSIKLSSDVRMRDYTEEYWSPMSQELKDNFNIYEKRLRDKHISLFAVAPQPLLFQLGTLLNRNYDVDVRQPQNNEISQWRWPEKEQTIELSLLTVSAIQIHNQAAITFEITCQLSEDELKSVFSDHHIYRIVAKEPNSTAIKSPKDLEAVMKLYRKTLGIIRKESGKDVNVALLPIAPASVSIQAGRHLMKGDPKITVYDRNSITKEWAPTLSF